ncbi:conserved hypothetical protein [Frankia sp. AgKG'84/4]
MTGDVLPFEDWDPDGGQTTPAAAIAVPEEMSAEGTDLPARPGVTVQRNATPGVVVAGVGGRADDTTHDTHAPAQTVTDSVRPGSGRSGGDGPVLSAEEWGRVQAARAPAWSANQRARAAAMFGLTLPPGQNTHAAE